MGKILEKGIEALGKAGDIIDQAVLDKDKAYALKMELVQNFVTNMLGGAGASVTKYTICGLVGLVVVAGTYAFLFNPALIARYKDYALTVTPIIGILTGAYLTGTTVQTVTKRDGK